MFVYKPHTGTVYAVAFSPDGSVLATNSVDCTTKITDLNSFQEVRSLREFWGPIAFSPDGRFIARGGYGIASWTWPDQTQVPLASAYPQRIFTESIQSVAFSPDSCVLVSQGENHPLHRWSIPSGESLPGGWGGTMGTNGGTQFANGSVAYSPDGKLLASSFGVMGAKVSNSVIMLWDAENGSLQGQLQAAFAYAHPTNIAFSPDGQLLAGIYGPAIRLFDVASRTLLKSVKPESKHFKGLVFTPDGRRLVSVSNDKLARVWDARTLSEETAYEWKIGKLTAVAVAPDGLRLAAGSDSGKVIVWDVNA